MDSIDRAAAEIGASQRLRMMFAAPQAGIAETRRE
jgi:hypothetical protein